jgi:hypothetical protein
VFNWKGGTDSRPASFSSKGEACNLQKAAFELQIAAFKLPKAGFNPKNP